MPTLKERAISNVKWCQAMFDGLCKDMPEDKLTHGVDNHALWTLGHLALTYDWLAGALVKDAKGASPESYQPLFGMGSKPSKERGTYPSTAELKATAAKAFDGFVKAIEAQSEADLDKAPTCDTGSFASTRWECIDRAAWHTGWHSGQVSIQRRSLGLKGLMG